jgi:hypothetical protein
MIQAIVIGAGSSLCLLVFVALANYISSRVDWLRVTRRARVKVGRTVKFWRVSWGQMDTEARISAALWAGCLVAYVWVAWVTR